jgi:enamine deaminase RidA (YjgF/YER057c/UK114 family)
MTDPQFFVTRGFGDALHAESHYSQAVRVGDRIETSGHGGWDAAWKFPDSIEQEIVQTFDNLEQTLQLAGTSWREVVAVSSFHVGPTHATTFGDVQLSVMSAEFERRMAGRAPIWTAVGVTALGDPKMRVEVRVTAIATR